jgi:AraC-like DNA-binding protein
MELRDSNYWRDAYLAGLQFTANRFLHREVRPHRHSGHMLSVSDTELEVRTRAGIFVVPPGTLLRIGPKVWHAIRAHSAPWRENAIYCSPSVARCVNTIVQPDAPSPSVGDEEVAFFAKEHWGYEFSECHHLLTRALYGNDPQAGAIGRALLRERLAHWIPMHSASMHASARELDSGDARVNRLYGLIASGFREPLTLGAMAEAVGWHPVYLQRRFKHALHFTPHELLVGHRIEYARDLMAGGALVTHAAYAAGFADQSHLHKTFLSTYAVVPGEYRRLSVLDALQPPSARTGVAG